MTVSRFDDTTRYAAYLSSPEGRLRAELSFANLCDFLPRASQPNAPRVLDIGGGTADTALRLARLGMHVTVVDSSKPMVRFAQDAVRAAGLEGKIEVKHGDAETLGDGTFDFVLCHNVLEYLDDPDTFLRSLPHVLTPSGLLSLLIRNQAGEVLKAALKSRDLDAAEHCLEATSCRESLYGGEVRLFAPPQIDNMLHNAGLVPIAHRGVRVIADYLPADYDRIFALERRLSMRQEFFGMARYLQVLARKGID